MKENLAYRINLAIFSRVASVKRKYHTFRMKVRCYLWNVDLGEGAKFWGLAVISKAPGSTIKIGRSSRFRSSAASNLIGVNRPCMLSTHGSRNPEIRIGDNCGFSGAVIGCFTSITIGNNVMVGANSLITDGDWHENDPRSGEPAPVVIGNNVWIGEGVKILKGTRIGDNALIGAGSVVSGEIPENAIAAGIPCRVLKINN